MKCKNCNVELEKENVFCPFCGTKVEQEETVLQKNLCRYCGKKLKAEAVFCEYCGKPALEPKENFNEEKEVTDKVDNDLEAKKPKGQKAERKWLE